MSTFVASPMVIEEIGININLVGEEFGKNLDLLYKTVNEMTNSDYISPDGLEIAKKIESYKESLKEVNTIINAYGNFCLKLSKKVTENQEYLMNN